MRLWEIGEDLIDFGSRARASCGFFLADKSIAEYRMTDENSASDIYLSPWLMFKSNGSLISSMHIFESLEMLLRSEFSNISLSGADPAIIEPPIRL